MWVELVVGSHPCSKRFFSKLSGFPLKKQHFQIPIKSGAYEHFQTRTSELQSLS